MKKLSTLFLSIISCSFLYAQTFTSSITLDGNTQFAALPKSLLNNASVFTIEFWVKTGESRGSGTFWQRPYLLGNATNGDNSGDFGITTDNGYISMFEGFSSLNTDQSFESASVKINDNNWHHIAAVNNGAYIYLYADGKLADSLTSGKPLITANAPLTVGAASLDFDYNGNSYANTNFPSAGTFAELRISNNVRYPANFTPATSFSADGNTVALYHFAGQCGLSSPDASSNQNNLLVNNAATACSTLPFGSDYTYNGTTQYAQVPDTLMNGLNTFTVEGWIKTTDMNTSSTYWQHPTFFGTASPGGNSGDFGVSSQGGYLYMWTGMNGGENYVQTKAFVSDNKWHHIAASANGTAVRLFADGVLTDSLPISRGLNTAGYPLTMMALYAPEIGSANNSVYFYHAGELDEVRLSNTTRYTADFTPAASPFSTDANTLALYHFDGCSGPFTADASGNNKNASLHKIAACSLPPQFLQGKILYSHHNQNAAAKQDSIYTIDSNGAKVFVTLGYRPRLSHTGRYLAFSNGPNSNSSYGANLWIRDLITQEEQLIVSNSDYLDYYDFYPNDSALVYSQSCSVYKVNLDGSNAYQNLNSYPGDCFSDDPTIRISDSLIAYHNVHYGLFTMKGDGSNPMQIPNTVPGDLVPSWSPDGNWLAYYKPIPGAYNGGTGAYVPTNSVYKIKVDGSDSTRLSFLSVNDTLAADPIWSRDMKNIYAIGRIRDTMGIYQITTDGSGSYGRIYTFDTSGAVSDYWLGLSDSLKSEILPITLINFSGTNLGKTIRLTWQTTEEINSRYFVVERSLDGRNFSDIASVAAMGNSSLTQQYVFNDADIPVFNSAAIIYYRLKLVDKDGQYKYTNVIAIRMTPVAEFSVYPNPSKGFFNITTKEISARLNIEILNTGGQQVYRQQFNNTQTATIDLHIARGIYFIKISDGKTITHKKLVIE